eukprot:jgi/Botrbrau1/4501/Bobra.0220s0034.1
MSCEEEPASTRRKRIRRENQHGQGFLGLPEDFQAGILSPLDTLQLKTAGMTCKQFCQAPMPCITKLHANGTAVTFDECNVEHCLKGCGPHVHAARAGHLQCLGQLCEMGLFLPLTHPDWASAGEARKCQVFEAAIAGCSGGHADVLAWLLSSGWLSDIGAIFPRHMQDLWEQHEDFAKAFPGLKIYREPFFLEYKLYSCAVQQATSSCMEALLNAGCSAVWICRIVAREGKADFLALALKRMPRYAEHNFWIWECAVSTGNHAVLELLVDCLRASRRIMAGDTRGFERWMTRLAHLAVSTGQGECLQLLKSTNCLERWSAAESAAHLGQLQWLQNFFQLDAGVLQRRVLMSAARSGSLACLTFLVEAGCQWTGFEAIWAAASGISEVLRFCLEQSQHLIDHSVRERAMKVAIKAGPLTACRLCMTMGTGAHLRTIVTTRHAWQFARRVWHASVLQYNAAVHHKSPCLTCAMLPRLERRC